MMTIYADREDPSWRVGWYDGDGALRDFSEGYTFRVEFLSMRNERIMYTKTGGITGASELPNIAVAWAVGELAEFAGKRYKLRLVAKDTADRESVFREGNLPVIQVLPAPAA